MTVEVVATVAPRKSRWMPVVSRALPRGSRQAQCYWFQGCHTSLSCSFSWKTRLKRKASMAENIALWQNLGGRGDRAAMQQYRRYVGRCYDQYSS